MRSPAGTGRPLPVVRPAGLTELDDLAQVVADCDPDTLESWAAELDDHSRALLERVMAERLAAGWRSSPALMGAHLDPQVFRPWRYVRFLADRFVAAVDGTSPRQIWNLPSRMGKTTLLRWGVVWGFDRRPESRWIWTTYGDQLAHESAVTIRDLLKGHGDTLRAQVACAPAESGPVRHRPRRRPVRCRDQRIDCRVRVW